jgi:hypothetical protein
MDRALDARNILEDLGGDWEAFSEPAAARCTTCPGLVSRTGPILSSYTRARDNPSSAKPWHSRRSSMSLSPAGLPGSVFPACGTVSCTISGRTGIIGACRGRAALAPTEVGVAGPSVPTRARLVRAQAGLQDEMSREGTQCQAGEHAHPMSRSLRVRVLRGRFRTAGARPSPPPGPCHSLAC